MLRLLKSSLVPNLSGSKWSLTKTVMKRLYAGAASKVAASRRHDEWKWAEFKTRQQHTSNNCPTAHIEMMHASWPSSVHMLIYLLNMDKKKNEKVAAAEYTYVAVATWSLHLHSWIDSGWVIYIYLALIDEIKSNGSVTCGLQSNYRKSRAARSHHLNI